MSELLSIGASGLRAYREALATTGDNVANAQTAGYVRRGLRLAEAPTVGSTPLQSSSNGPGGVMIAGVTRAVDVWLADDARLSSGIAERSAARAQWLGAAEMALDDGPDGFGQSATALFNASDALAVDPSSTPARLQFLQSVEGAASALRRTSAQLGSVSAGIAADAQNSVGNLNTNLASLEQVNDGLRRAREGSTHQASLLDQRDTLVNAISAILPVTIIVEARQSVSLRMAGPGAPVLLDQSGRAQASVSASATGHLSFSLSPGGAFTPAASGRLAGLSDAADHVTSQRSELDVLAGQFATQINAAHQAGLDANGQAGLPLLTFSGSAATIAATPLLPSQVAAASATRDNGAMLAFNALRIGGGVESSWATLVAGQSQRTSFARAENAANQTRFETASQARDAVSAVDLDHEAAELLRFQQAYEGSARVIQVARETFQSILNAI